MASVIESRTFLKIIKLETCSNLLSLKKSLQWCNPDSSRRKKRGKGMIGILIYSQSEAAVDTIDAHGRETKEKRMNFLQRSKTE